MSTRFVWRSRQRAPRPPERLEAAAAALPEDTLVIAYQTIFIEYLPADARRAYVDGMHGWLARSTRPAVWVELELTREPSRHSPAELRATFRGTDDDLHTPVLARCGYHPGAVDVQPEGVSAFRPAFPRA